MKTPKYTDLHRYPNGWKSSAATNVAETFERIRKQQEQTAAEQKAKVAQIKRTK